MFVVGLGILIVKLLSNKFFKLHGIEENYYVHNLSGDNYHTTDDKKVQKLNYLQKWNSRFGRNRWVPLILLRIARSRFL